MSFHVPHKSCNIKTHLQYFFFQLLLCWNKANPLLEYSSHQGQQINQPWCKLYQFLNECIFKFGRFLSKPQIWYKNRAITFPFFSLYFANKQVNMVLSLSSVAVNILCVPINIWEKFIGFCNHFEIRVSARAKARGGVGYQQGRRKYCVWWEQQENIKEISSHFPLHSPGWNFYTLYVSSCNWKGGKWGLSVARAVVQEKKAYLHKLTSVNSFSWFYQGCVWANLVTGFLWI